MGSEGDGWEYWLRWQTAECFLITVSPAIAAAIVLKRRRSRRSKEPQEQERELEVELECGAPCLRGRGVPALVLPVYRGLVVVAMGSVLYAMLRHRGLLEFYFYTQWTFVLVIIYFLIGTLVSAHACWLYSSQKTSPDVEHGNASILFHAPLLTTHTSTRPNPAAPLAYSMQIIYQTCAGAVMLTDVVFWCLLVPFMSSSHFSVNLIMGCMHSLNLIFLLVDTFLNSMPFPWFGITYFILWSCTYVIFQWILHACGFSWWPYPFLELATPWAPLWYFCMAVIHVPCYGIYWLIVKAKDTYFPRLFPHSYVKLDN